MVDILVWLLNNNPPNPHTKLSAHQSLFVFVDGFLHRFATNRLRLNVLFAGAEHTPSFRAIELLLKALECAFDVFSLLDRNDENNGKLDREDSGF